LRKELIMMVLKSRERYEDLKGNVLELLREGKRAVEETVAQETLRTYHNVGRLLDQYLLGEKDRAAYGEQMVVGLAKDVGLSKNTLYRALGFFRLYPIFPNEGNLGWGHYLSLLSLPTVKAQRFFEDRAVRNGWNASELEKQIRSVGPEVSGKGKQEPTKITTDLNLPALRGQFYTYKISGQSPVVSGQRRVDLGFGMLSAWPIEGV
jgi:hypothetical protein